MKPDSKLPGNGRLASTAFLALLLLACVVLSPDNQEVLPSPDNLKLELQTLTPQYSTVDTFLGTLRFTSLGDRSVRENCPGGHYHVGLYDVWGTLRRDYVPDSGSVVTFLLGPDQTFIDTLRFPLSVAPDTIPAGPYRLRAWLPRHEDIYSEISLSISPPQRH
jgi:hypothetical protein